jgi:Ca-activated chloride channel family protein
MIQPTLLLSPVKSAVPAQGSSFDLLVRVQAPARPTALSTPQVSKRLALVVDRSGSMSSKLLHEALRCVMHIARHLAPTDQLTPAVYDTRVDVLRPLSPIGLVDELQAIVNGVDSGGSTNLHGGWLGGAQLLEGSDAASISWVLLLSGGQANAGLLDQSVIELQCGEWLKQGVSTTTMGLGNSFNEDLMIGMARAGGGQQYYGQTAEDLYDSFDEELSLLQAMCLRQLDVTMVPATGVIIEPLSVAQQNTDSSYRLSDLAWGAESWLALRLHLSPGAVVIRGIYCPRAFKPARWMAKSRRRVQGLCGCQSCRPRNLRRRCRMPRSPAGGRKLSLHRPARSCATWPTWPTWAT